MSIKGTIWIIVSIIAALCLTLLPLPAWAVWCRPEWLLLVVIYWCLTVPHRINIGIAWILGLLLDALHGTLLGEHALAFALVAYITVKLHRRMRFFPISQQAVAVFGLIILSHIIIFVVQGLIGQAPQTWMFWLPSVTSMMLWPWVFLVLKEWRQRFKIA